jgi:hypothetical protein
VIERHIEGRGTTGVRIGDGSLYDSVVEELLGGVVEVDVENVADEYVEWAMQLLADARAHRRRSITETVEAAFEAAHRQPRRRRRRATSAT